MPDAVASTSTLPEAIHPPAVSLREIWPWSVLAVALLAVISVVAGSGGTLHELAHDGRHLLGFPCH